MISSSYVNSNWSYSPETLKSGCDLCDLDLWPLTLTSYMDISSLMGNNSWKFRDDGNIVTKVWQTDRQTDRQIGGQTDERAIADCVFAKICWSVCETEILIMDSQSNLLHFELLIVSRAQILTELWQFKVLTSFGTWWRHQFRNP